MVRGVMGIGPWQIVLVVVLVVLLFPKRLGGLGASLGKALKDFKKSVNDDEPSKQIESDDSKQDKS